MIKTPYEDLRRDVLENGSHKDDRTGTGTTSVFGRQIRYDLSEQLSREPYPYPTLELRKRDSIDEYEYEDVQIVGYKSHPAIKAEVAV